MKDPHSSPSLARPLLVSIEMGYGHLRAAQALSEALKEPILLCDQPPLAGRAERAAWSAARVLYERLSRLPRLPALGAAAQKLLEAITDIPPLVAGRERARPSAGARLQKLLFGRGIGQGLVDRLKDTGRPLLTTYFTPALAADQAGLPNLFCVATDSDLNRAWAPLDPGRSRLRYLVPSERAGRRLQSYGVPGTNIRFTGFPLPPALLGGPELPALRHNLAARLSRLDPQGRFTAPNRRAIEASLGPLPPADPTRPPLLVFAVGGAGAQSRMARRFLPSLATLLRKNRLRLALVAGTRFEIAHRFERWLLAQRLSVESSTTVQILVASGMSNYLTRFNQLLSEADILWTKPSELTFFGALGLPLVFAPPLGIHERANRDWALGVGAGLDGQDPGRAGQWLADWLDSGALAQAAWAGYRQLPKHGLYNILECVRHGS